MGAGGSGVVVGRIPWGDSCEVFFFSWDGITSASFFGFVVCVLIWLGVSALPDSADGRVLSEIDEGVSIFVI